MPQNAEIMKPEKTESIRSTHDAGGQVAPQGYNGWRALFLLPALILTCAAALSAQNFLRGIAEPELLNYIRGKNADPSCDVCLNSAKKYFDEKRRDEILKKTAGMAFIPGGKYYIGSPAGVGDPDEHPGEEIYIDAFYIDKTDVTLNDYALFTRVTAANYPEWQKPNGRYNIDTGSDNYYKRLNILIKTCGTCPVFGITWENADAYCRWKNKHLPTEAQWEAAARAGSREKYSFGDTQELAGEYSWNENNSGDFPRPVGQKKPNKFGLYDTSGNVWEWVSDLYDKNYYSVRPAKNPTGPQAGPQTGKEHVIRGGSWAFDVDSMRVANRASYQRANDDIGFRCAVSESELTREPE